MGLATWLTTEDITNARMNDRHLALVPNVITVGVLDKGFTHDGETALDLANPHAKCVIPLMAGRYLVVHVTMTASGGSAPGVLECYLWLWGESFQLWTYTYSGSGVIYLTKHSILSTVVPITDVRGLFGTVTLHLYRTSGSGTILVDGGAIQMKATSVVTDTIANGDPTNVTT